MQPNNFNKELSLWETKQYMDLIACMLEMTTNIGNISDSINSHINSVRK